MFSFDNMKDHDGLDDFCLTLSLHELGQAARAAYFQGVTPELVRAICGAAYGDWCESHDEGFYKQNKAPSTFQHHEGFQPKSPDEHW